MGGEPHARTFTFHLRPGATFSDGTPVDAAAVKATFDAVPKLGAKASLAIGYLSGYTGTRVVDDLTAAVSFAQPNAQFLQATSTFSLGLVSPASAARSADQRCTEGIVGSGPFVLTRYEANRSITPARRTGYHWGSSLWRKPGEAYLDKVVFTVVPEAGVRTGSLQSGQVDAIGSVGLADESALRGGGNVNLQARANPGVLFNLGLNNSRLMRIVDVLLAIPGFFLTLALVTALGFGTVKVAVAVGLASVASFARVMRAEVLRVRQAVYVEAARVVGARWYSVLLRHVLPNALGPVLVLATLEFGIAVLAVSSLSFLGYGAPPPAPEWGTLVSTGRNYLANAWWLSILPGLTVAATVLATSRIARALDGEWATER